MKNDIYELTNPQKSIWYIEKFYNGSAINNICGSLIIKEIIDLKMLEKAVNIYIQLNDSFHIRLFVENSVPKQYFCKPEYINFEIINLNTENEISNVEKEMVSTPFNIIESPLFKFKLFKLSNGYGGFVINAHHIISDAATFAILGSSIARIYSNLKNNEEINPNVPSYKDYILSEKNYLNSDKFKKDEKYWNNTFKTVLDVASIPSSFRDSINYSSDAKRVSFLLPKSIVNRIRNLCSKEKISIYNFFMSIYSLYIGRVSNLEEFAIGTPILNRTNFKEKNTSGIFINTVPFKITIDNNSTFLSFVTKIAKDSLAMLRHQKYPYYYLLENLRNKFKNVPSLYDILISYQITKTVDKTIDLPYSVDWVGSDEISSGIEIHFHDNNDSGNLTISYDYLIDKYSKDDIIATHQRILYIANQLLDNINILMKDIQIVTPEEKNLILNKFNNTKVDYPSDKSIIDLFEAQVKLHPDNVAVVFGNQKLTYKELNEKSNSLAHYLIDNYGSEPSIIGILMDRSLEMIICIIAVLKTGNAYIPIAPDYPTDRILYMLEDSGCKIVLSKDELYLKLNKKLIFIDASLKNSHVYNYKTINLNTKIDFNNLSYIIYTSGSTGKPKGVMLTYKGINNLVNYCNNYIEYLKNNKYGSIVSVTTISFDIFFFESIISLQKGLRLVIANEDQQTIPRLLIDLIKKENIEIIQTTPSRMKLLLDNIRDEKAIASLKYVILAGEPFPDTLADSLRKIGNIKLYNGYGPSETTIFSTLTDVSNIKEMTIGRPLDNTQIYIVDKNITLLPNKISGEICIAGDGVGKGYINNSQLTKKSFIKNPFIPDSILYKTGDLGFYNADGTITCLGRIDNQVKIRGLRIELEEIEKALLKIKEIKNCVVAKKIQADGHELLCAYYVKNKDIDETKIRKLLKKTLTNYMIPQYFIEIEQIPYTPNGKIDKNSLPMPVLKTTSEVIKPRNKEEVLLKEIFKKVLKQKNINICDDFFELGGDSLSAINLSTMIYDQLHIQISIKQIFEHPTIEALAKLITDSEAVEVENKITKIQKMDYYPTSSAQKRIYYSSLIDGLDSTLYNVSGTLLLDNIPDIERLNNCFKKIIQNNEAFRTYFQIENNEVVQKVLDNVEFNIELESSKNSDIDQITENFIRPFDLSIAPLIRAKLVKLKNNKALLIIDMHHIISDGSTLNLLTKQISDLYNGKRISKKEYDYTDYAVWENNNLKNKKYLLSEKYWLSQYKDDIPVLNLPTNYSRPAVQSFQGAEIFKIIDENLTSRINIFCKENNITPFMFLISIYYIILSIYSRTDDIVIGTPISGRYNKQTLDIMGMFVNTLALRNKVDSSKTFIEFLSQLKARVLDSFEHQDYPLDTLVKKLGIQRDTSRNSLFDVMFIYQNNAYSNLKLNDINCQYYISKTNTSKYDLSLEAIPEDNKIKLRFEYCTKLFTKAFVENFCVHYMTILNNVLDNINIQISNIKILSKKEEKQILNEFNDTKSDYPYDKNVIDLFEEQVLINKNKTALVFEDLKLTYNQLNIKANQLSNYLLDKYNLSHQDVIGIFIDKSVESILAILSIVKCGCIFVPIDTEYPDERINYILEDSNAKIILTKEEYNNLLHTDIPKVNIDLNNYIYDSYDGNNFTHNIDTNDLIYIMYTSGSTGKPKGVMIKHQNVVRLVKNTNYIDFSLNERILQTGSIVFDACTFEIWGSLLNGGALYLMKKQNMLDQNYFEHYLKDNKITTIFLTTALFNQYCEASSTIFSSLRNLLTGGEAVSTRHIKLALKNFPNLNLVHVYGPTENTTFSTYYIIKNINDNTVPIGKAIANSTTYIVSKDGQLLPIGVPGELWVGGDGVGNGYLNKENLTKEKFIDNPFGSGKVYKTGDLVKLLPNGNIEFIRRIDNQVKIRGFRIELNEIDTVLLEYPYITKTYTIVRIINDKPYIITYFTSDKNLNISDINVYLQEKLPLYMVPHFLINLAAFPLTINGKIDKNKLPEPELETLHQYIQPKNDTQKQLCNIWCKLFGMKKVSITDNFFELGGDSLTAIKLQTEALKSDININYSDIFEYPTIRGLSERNQNKQLYKIDKNYDYTNINKLLEYNNINNIEYSKNEIKINNLLLCGATGFLGAHILDYFLSHTDGVIYCLVREKENMDSIDRLKKILNFYFENKYDNYFGNRILVVDGDITAHNLGLSEKEYKKLGKQIDVVINSAALVKHFGDFKMFQSINVVGTKNIIDFCKNFDIKLYHISTMSVAGINTPDQKINNDEERILFNETNLYVGQNLNNPYVYTKFEAEKIILEEFQNGLKACILRMGNISNRISDGKFQINVSENAFINRIKSLLNIKVLQNKFLNHAIEFTPVDSAAEAIINIIKNNSKFTVLHLFNTKIINIPDVIAILKSLNYNIQMVDDVTFKNTIKEFLKDDNLKIKISGLIPDLNSDKTLALLSKTLPNGYFTTTYLSSIGFKWPEIDKDYIKKYIEYFKKIGYIEK